MAVLLMSITVSTGWAVVGGLSLVFVLPFSPCGRVRTDAPVHHLEPGRYL
jgi:hypothetical protein